MRQFSLKIALNTFVFVNYFQFFLYLCSRIFIYTYYNMALAIKAIPTLYGDEARRFRDMADEAESRYETTGRKDRDTNPFVISKNTILC